jgi:hypothetical protein
MSGSAGRQVGVGVGVDVGVDVGVVSQGSCRAELGTALPCVDACLPQAEYAHATNKVAMITAAVRPEDQLLAAQAKSC